MKWKPATLFRQRSNALDEGYAYLIFDAGVKDRVKAVNTYIEKGFVQSDGKQLKLWLVNWKWTAQYWRKR